MTKTKTAALCRQKLKLTVKRVLVQKSFLTVSQQQATQVHLGRELLVQLISPLLMINIIETTKECVISLRIEYTSRENFEAL